jgi:hypothetical protein
MKYRSVLNILISFFYVGVCFSTTYIYMVPKPLPNYFYPNLYEIKVPNPYEKDCYGIENNYCWYWGHDI